jgi:hypothetical protein
MWNRKVSCPPVKLVWYNLNNLNKKIIKNLNNEMRANFKIIFN